MKLGASRELADLLGGYDGGWSFWLAALAALEQAIVHSRDRSGAFTSHPPGELRRFLRDVDDALGLAALGVDVQLLVNDEGDGNGDRRRESIDAILRARLRELVD